jgi:hypothetical protein
LAARTRAMAVTCKRLSWRAAHFEPVNAAFASASVAFQLSEAMIV